MNRRELAFCTAYIRERCPTKAAIEAGYSESTAIRRGHEILRRPHIQDQIHHMTQMMMEHITLDAAMVINELGAVALARPDEFFKPDDLKPDAWTGKSPDELTPMQRAAVKSIQTRDVYEGTGKKRKFVRQEFRYTLHDKMDALDKLGKHFNVFKEVPARGGLAGDFEDMPQEDLEAAMRMIEDLRHKAADRRRDEEAIDGEVLSND